MEQLTQLLKPIQNVLEYVVVFLYGNVTANYGLVIILLTIIVRLILTPLTLSQTRSMARMQMLQPELKKIQKEFNDDKQKQYFNCWITKPCYLSSNPKYKYRHLNLTI